MFLICNGYVIGMSSHTFDITYKYQKHTQNSVWDNFSNNYTAAIEIYFEQFPFFEMEFNSVKISFESLNININKNTTIKINSNYKYYRSILNLSPDGLGGIQRRLYINFQATYDNDSPPTLPIYVLIYGIKDEALNKVIDLSIYDFEKYCEISPLEYFKMYMPMI